MSDYFIVINNFYSAYIYIILSHVFLMKFYIAAHMNYMEEAKDISNRILERNDELTLNLTCNGRGGVSLDSTELKAYDFFVFLSHDEDPTAGMCKLFFAISSYELYKKPRIYTIGENKDNALIIKNPYIRCHKSFDEFFKDIDGSHLKLIE